MISHEFLTEQDFNAIKFYSKNDVYEEEFNTIQKLNESDSYAVKFSYPTPKKALLARNAIGRHIRESRMSLLAKQNKSNVIVFKNKI